jgi:hypothetical protein
MATRKPKSPTRVFSGPELQRVLAFAERQNEGVPPSVREGAIFAHLRAWACSRLPLDRGDDFPKIRPTELIRESGRITGVLVHVR